MWRANKRRLAAACVLGVGTILAVTSFAAASTDTTIQSEICPPFDAPNLTVPSADYQTEDDSASVAGTADAGMTVEITDNDAGVGATTAASDDTFSLTVPLSAGSNALRANVTNSCGTIKSSSSVMVTRIVSTPPAPIPTRPAPPAVVQNLKPVPITPALPATPAPQVSSPNAPVILTPKSGQRVAQPFVLVNGTADAGDPVQVLVNGRVVAQVIATTDGTFRTQVPLSIGSNTIQAQITTGTSGSIASKIVIVTYAPPAASLHQSWVHEYDGLALVIAVATLLLSWWFAAKARHNNQQDDE